MYNMPKDLANKVFITAAGYVIPFDKDGRAIKEFCPGVNNLGETAISRGNGWLWTDKGQMRGLSDSWNRDLEIVGEYTGKFPFTGPPEGFRFPSGYPKIEKINQGDYYFCNILSVAVRAHKVPVPDAIKLEKITNNICEPNTRVVKTPDHIWNTLNYFLFEPIENAAKVAKGSLRYLLLGGMICFLVMPMKTYDFARSILPKISIKIGDKDENTRLPPVLSERSTETSKDSR